MSHNERTLHQATPTKINEITDKIMIYNNLSNLVTLVRLKLSSLVLLFALLVVASCSDDSDSEKYQSAPPKITDIAVVAIDGQRVESGKSLVATAVQDPIGKLLYQASYNWTINPAPELSSFNKGAIYDNEPANPTDTFTVAQPGIYTIKFTATYKISGASHQTWNGIIDIPDGTVSYSTSTLSYKVEATKTVKIN